MKRKVSYGLIGCGEIAVQSAKAIARSAASEIVMVQDVNEEVARDLADKHDVPYCLDWDELLSNKCLDAVYCAVPHYLLPEAAMAAAAAGKHVIVEKPMATTLAAADAMIAACREAGVVLSVAFCARYTERARLVKGMIEDGAIGKVVGIDFGQYAYKPQSYWSGGWTGRVKSDWRTSKRKSGGGVFLMNLVHSVDLLRYLTGLEVVSISAICDTFKTDVEVEDHLVATMRYDNGAIGAVRTSTIVEGKAPPEVLEGDRIIGLDGQIFVATENVHVFFSRPYKDYAPCAWHSIRSGDPWGGREEMFTDFSKALMCGRKPGIAALDGRKALEVCLGAYRSSETGQVVSFQP